MDFVHVEIEQNLESKLSEPDLKNAVLNELKITNLLPLNTKLEKFSTELLNNHVKCIRIYQSDNAAANVQSQISINDDTKILFYVYRLEQEDVNLELFNSDGDGEVISAAKHCILPSVHFDGIWESLIYDDRVKDKLLMYTTSAMLFSNHKVNQNIININKVLLLHGPPGTGKTSLCRGMAQKLSIRFKHIYPFSEFIEINSHSLFSKYYSESGKLVMKMFVKIREHLDYGESLVFVLIDEIESLTHSRETCMSGSEPSDSIRVVNAILTQLDSIRNYPNVIILTTSNLKNAIDTAFIDRVDMEIYIGPPGLNSIYNIYLSCINELIRAKIIEEEVEEIHFVPFDLITSSTQEIEENVSDNYIISSALLQLSKISTGFSGRILRKVPFLAHGNFLQSGSGKTLKFIKAMQQTIEYMKCKNNHLKL